MIARNIADIEKILKSQGVTPRKNTDVRPLSKRDCLLFSGIAASAWVIAVLWGTGLMLSFIAKLFME